MKGKGDGGRKEQQKNRRLFRLLDARRLCSCLQGGHRRVPEINSETGLPARFRPPAPARVLEREAKFEPAFIHDRDFQWLLESDVGVFEISNPSLGVGSEISDMIYARKTDPDALQAWIRGKDLLLPPRQGRIKICDLPRGVSSLRDLEDAGAKISEFIEAQDYSL